MSFLCSDNFQIIHFPSWSPLSFVSSSSLSSSSSCVYLRLFWWTLASEVKNFYILSFKLKRIKWNLYKLLGCCKFASNNPALTLSCYFNRHERVLNYYYYCKISMDRLWFRLQYAITYSCKILQYWAQSPSW